MLGDQIALRDRMRPMLAIIILLLEIMTLGSLIVVEIEQGTARALLVTPMSTPIYSPPRASSASGWRCHRRCYSWHWSAAFAHQPLLMLTTLVMASVFVVGVGFLLASVTRDTNSVTGWGMVILIVFAIPGFGIVIPASCCAGWAKVIPSYYLIDTINRVVNYGAGWSDVYGNLLIMAGLTAVLLGGGLLALRRRFQ